MSMQTRNRISQLIVAASLIVATFNALAQSTVTIDVPNRGGFPNHPIFKVKAIVDVDNDSPVTFKITDPNLDTKTIQIPVPATGSCSFAGPSLGSLNDYCDFEPDLSRPDTPRADGVEIAKLDEAETPGRYEISLTLNSNRFFSMGGEGCLDDTRTPTELFTITVPVASAQTIEGVCLQSFETDAVCGDAAITFIDPSSDALHASVNGENPDPTCYLDRPPIDVALALDKSGSMRREMPPSGGPTKISALRNAVSEFMSQWDLIRQFDVPDESVVPPADRVVIVPFSNDVDCSMFPSEFCDSSGVPILVPLETPGDDTVVEAITNIFDDDESVVPTAGGATSIGDGLHEAATAMGPLGTSETRRKVILLMSDGRENSTRRVRLARATTPDVPIEWNDVAWGAPSIDEDVIVLLTDGSGWSQLDNEEDLSIYSVTLGSADTIKPAVNHGIARATGGFYINSETDDASILTIFFVELLQNFLHFNTWEPVHIDSQEVAVDQSGQTSGFTLPFPLSSTSRVVSLNVAWDAEKGNICADITPPGFTAPTELVCSVDGRLRWDSSLPLAPPYDVSGDWQITFRPVGEPDPSTGIFQPATRATTIPFYFIIGADDLRINSEFTVLPGDYIAGDAIPVQLTLTESGRPITGLTQVFAIVAQPGVGIGELLASSSADTTPPSSDDTSSNADSMLENALAGDPKALQFNRITVQLTDDGAGQDDQAGDGIYNGQFFSDAPGHYHILFSAEGQSENSARFRRQRLESTVVRAFPKDLFVAVTEQLGDNNVITYRLVMKPRTSNGHLLGPGWGSYFWFDPPNSDPVKPRDNLDGTYSVTFTDGPVPVHFLNIAQVLDDDTTFEDLPVPLTDDNKLMSDACGGDCSGQNGPWSASLSLGQNDPNSSFGSTANGSWGFDLGVQYAFNPMWSVELAYGQDMFNGRGGVPDIDVGHLKLNAKAFIPVGSNRGFASVGYGSYNFDPGPTEDGFNLGLGYQFDFSSRWDVEAKLNYHDIDASGASISFYTLQVGLRYNF